MADRLSQKVGGPGGGTASDSHSTATGPEEGGLGGIYPCEITDIKVRIKILKVKIEYSKSIGQSWHQISLQHKTLEASVQE